MRNELAFVAALAVALATTPGACILARRAGVLAPANSDVPTHTQPKPLLGGLGILAGAGAGCAIAEIRADYSTLCAIALVTGLGLLKDLRQDPFPPIAQLAVQLLACWVLASTRFPFASIDALNATLLGILIINCVNLLDVMDGLAATVYTLIALIVAGLVGGPAGTVALALAGGILGFLCWNRPEAAVFMGDIGSFGIGLALFAVVLRAHGEGTPLVALAMAFAVPMLDLAATLGRRLYVGRPLMIGDASHPSLHMLNAGVGPWLILALYSIATGLSGIAAIIIARNT